MERAPQLHLDRLVAIPAHLEDHTLEPRAFDGSGKPRRCGAGVEKDIGLARRLVGSGKPCPQRGDQRRPAGVGINEYYASEEEYFHALAAELAKEYRAIVAAGILVQVDDPFLCDILVDPALDDAQKQRRAELYVAATNAALDGIPAEMVRFHTCYGINEGPRLFEAALADVVEHMFRVDAGSYSFEAANPRHEHEYHLFERIKVPPGKVICPGMITHASNIVEHPELIAERIVRFAELVGRENVMAGADCGFSSQALYRTEVHPTVVWEKLKALRQGADLATRRLWGR